MCDWVLVQVEAFRSDTFNARSLYVTMSCDLLSGLWFRLDKSRGSRQIT